MFRTTLTAKAPRNLATMARFSYIQKNKSLSQLGGPASNAGAAMKGFYDIKPGLQQGGQSPATTPNGSSAFAPASNKGWGWQDGLPSSDKPD